MKSGRYTDGLRSVEDGMEYSSKALEANSSGRLATIISAFALLFSGYSFYETVLRAPELAVFVPPQMGYTDPDRPTSPMEVFVIPLTLANDGARSGTILSIDMKVTNPRTNQTKNFYAAQLGSWNVPPQQRFMPVVLTGKDSWSKQVQFMPLKDEKVERILDFEPGDYTAEITLNTATVSGPSILGPRVKPLKFKIEAGKLDYRYFNGTNTIRIWATPLGN